MLLCAAAAAAALAGPPGERLYREGRLPDGAPLVGRREAGNLVEGAAAACVNCHRPSGLGNIEGIVRVPPILGPYLFRDGETNERDLALPHVAGFTPRPWAYDSRTLAAALRTGQRPDGTELSPLMPRYTLDDASLSVLTDYLQTLSSGPARGVSPTDVEFATIVTPDADPAARDAMLRVLDAFFAAQRATVGARVHAARGAGEVEYRVSRRWHLHVWTLSGAATTWAGQLDEHLAAEPVFAVLSGIGRSTWAPIHRFCEEHRLPCVLPNVDLPVVAEQDFYPLYYSRGVLLEADLIATQLEPSEGAPRGRLVQVFRHDDVGAAAAAALAARARRLGLVPESRPLTARADARVAELRRVLADLHPSDRLVLWLRPEDLRALGERMPPLRAAFASGLMGELDDAPLPDPWRARVRFAYPVDPPALRRVRMNFPLAWLRQHDIPVDSLRVEADTYLACSIASDATDDLLDAYVPEYLLERLEMMLSRRLATGYYPRLGLAPGQRFASKGGYLVTLGTGRETATPTTAWLVP